jgi:hypothetical protein
MAAKKKGTAKKGAAKKATPKNTSKGQPHSFLIRHKTSSDEKTVTQSEWQAQKLGTEWDKVDPTSGRSMPEDADAGANGNGSRMIEMDADDASDPDAGDAAQ